MKVAQRRLEHPRDSHCGQYCSPFPNPAVGDVPPWPKARTMRHHLLSLPAAPASRPGYGGGILIVFASSIGRGSATAPSPSPLPFSGRKLAKDDHAGAAW